MTNPSDRNYAPNEERGRSPTDLAYAHTLLPRTQAPLPTKTLDNDRHVEPHAGEYTLIPLLFSDKPVLEFGVGDVEAPTKDVLFAREALEFAFEKRSEYLGAVC